MKPIRVVMDGIANHEENIVKCFHGSLFQKSQKILSESLGRTVWWIIVEVAKDVGSMILLIRVNIVRSKKFDEIWFIFTMMQHLYPLLTLNKFTHSYQLFKIDILRVEILNVVWFNFHIDIILSLLMELLKKNDTFLCEEGIKLISSYLLSEGG